MLSLLHPCTPCTLVEINEIKCIRQGAHKSNRISSSLCSHNIGLSLKYIYEYVSKMLFLYLHCVSLTCMLGDNKDIVNCELWIVKMIRIIAAYSHVRFLYYTIQLGCAPNATQLRSKQWLYTGNTKSKALCLLCLTGAISTGLYCIVLRLKCTVNNVKPLFLVMLSLLQYQWRS